MPRPKLIKSPEHLLELFKMYKKEVEDNPFKKSDWVGKDAKEVKRPYIKTMVFEGFELFVCDHTDISYPDMYRYFDKKNEAYKEFRGVAARIKAEIRHDQISKGFANLANPSITQRINNLVDRTQNEEITRPILEGGLELPKDE